MKQYLISIVAIFILMAVPAYAQLGTEVGFSRSFLRIDDETVHLGSPTPGLTFKIAMNESTNSRGTLVKEPTWGFIFGTNVSSDNDEDILITSLTTEIWAKWREITFSFGPQLDFFEEGDLIYEQSNNIGVAGAVRFDAQGLPAELGGSWTFSYDGVENLELSHVHLGLVNDF